MIPQWPVRFGGPAVFSLCLCPVLAWTMPVANAGKNNVVNEGERVVLDGAGSEDSFGKKLTYQWQQVAGPDVHLSLSSSTASFIAPDVENNQPVLYSFELTVANAQKERAKDTVYVIVQNKNNPPVAVITSESSADRDDVVILKASSSTDPERDNLKYLWYQTAGPPVMLSMPFGAQAVISFTEPPAGVAYPYMVTMALRVTDGFGASNETQQTILVTNFAGSEAKAMEKKERKNLALAQSLAVAYAEKRRQKLAVFVADEESHIDTALKNSDWNAALTHAANVLAINPTRTLPVKTVATVEQQAIRQWSDDLHEGHNEFREKNYLSAIRWYRAAEKILTDNIVTSSLLQACIAALDEQSLLRENSDTAIASNNAESRTLYSVGLRHYSAGQLKLAADMWKRALALDPKNRLASTAYNRVVAEMQQ